MAPTKIWICYTEILFCNRPSSSYFCKQIENRPLSGYAPALSNYFSGPKVTFVFNNLRIFSQDLTLLLSKSNSGEFAGLFFTPISLLLCLYKILIFLFFIFIFYLLGIYSEYQ